MVKIEQDRKITLLSPVGSFLINYGSVDKPVPGINICWNGKINAANIKQQILRGKNLPQKYMDRVAIFTNTSSFINSPPVTI